MNGAGLEHAEAGSGTLVVPGAWVLAAAAPVAVVAAAAAAGILSWEGVAAAWSVRAWGAAAVLLGAAWTVRAVMDRRWVAALAAGALACALGQAAASYAYRADATIDLGEGEGGVDWQRERVGPAARLPEVAVAALPERGEGMAQLRVDGRDVTTVVGRDVRLSGGDTLAVRGVYEAPGFEVRHVAGGEVEASGYLKIAPGRREFFQVGVLPHRFYVTLPASGAGQAGARPTFRLLVQRGKEASVPARDVAIGERVEFEGLSLEFAEGARWARIELHRRAGRWLAVAAAALLAAAALVAVRERGRRA